MDLTIIYGFRNRELERVKQSLNSLRQQTDNQFKVIFVDYGSDEKTSSQIRSLINQYNFCTYVYNETRGMPWNRAHALNTGIRITSSDFLFTADVDLIFESSFVSIAKHLGKPNTAIFFSVIYFPHKIKNIDILNHKKYKISDPSGSGLALLHRPTIEAMRGFDEFYSFWGNEDNDMEIRLKKAGISSEFYSSKNLLFHQWHPVSKKSKVDFPKNWNIIQYDYMMFYKNDVIRNTNIEWGKCFNNGNRPAWNKLSQYTTQYIILDSRLDFLQYYLCIWLNSLEKDNILSIKIVNSVSHLLKKSKVTRIVKLIQNIFNIFNIEIAIENKNNALYADPIMFRDMVARFIMSNKAKLQDYAWEITDDYFKLVLIKKNAIL